MTSQPGASSQCSPGRTPVNAYQRFCGTALSTSPDIDDQSVGDTVCGKCYNFLDWKCRYNKGCIAADCTAPFTVDIVTDALGDNGETADNAANEQFSRGERKMTVCYTACLTHAFKRPRKSKDPMFWIIICHIWDIELSKSIKMKWFVLLCSL